MRPVVKGPTATPPSRKPSTGEPPGILDTRVTASTEVKSSTSTSVRPASCASCAPGKSTSVP